MRCKVVVLYMCIARCYLSSLFIVIVVVHDFENEAKFDFVIDK